MFGKSNKVKQLSPQETLLQKIEAMQSGQAISYTLPDTFGGGLAVISLNPEYPEKGKKFVISLEALTDGKPSGKRRYLWDSNKAKDLSSWVFDRLGKPYES